MNIRDMNNHQSRCVKLKPETCKDCCAKFAHKQVNIVPIVLTIFTTLLPGFAP